MNIGHSSKAEEYIVSNTPKTAPQNRNNRAV